MERTILVRSDRNIWDHLWRWSTSTGPHIRSPKCPFSFDLIIVPSTALLHRDYKNNNQTRVGLGRVCATGMYYSIWYVEFPRFQTRIFVEWKAPLDSVTMWEKTYLTRLKRPHILPQYVVRIKYITPQRQCIGMNISNHHCPGGHSFRVPRKKTQCGQCIRFIYHLP